MEQRKLGLFGATSLTLVALVGTGMFFGPSIAAGLAGPAAILVWIVLGLQAVYIALIFGELVSLHPKAGGIYEFAKQAYGRLPSFMIGWTMWLVATINTSILIVGALQYAAPLLPLTTQLGISLALVAALHYIAYRGMGATEALLDFFAATLIAFVVITILGGTFQVDPSNYTPFFTSTPIMLFVALFFILETYFGWEAACFLAEETKNPRRTIPKALLISSSIGAALGILLATVLYGIIPATTLAESTTPLLDVFTLLFGGVGGFLLKIGIFLALIGSAAGNIVSGPRLIQAMARDKLFIEQLSQVNERTGTPAYAIVFQGVVSALVLVFAFGQYTLLLSLMVPLAILMYIPTLLALPVLRRKQPGERIFKAPLGSVGAVVASMVFLGALIGWIVVDPAAWGVLRFVAGLLAFGVPIYLLVSIYYNPSTQLFFMDALAYPALWLEDLVLPRKIRNHMLGLFEGLQKKTVLEFGAGVGSLTMHLAEEVTPAGKVYAIEAGRSNIDLLLRRIKQHEHVHVTALHDEHISTRLHPRVTEVDAVFSTGMLGYLQDKQKVLKELAAVMPQHAPICFMEWVDYFGFLPNPPWLSDLDALKREFREAGFSVRVEKVKGLFWNYLLVYGVKSDEDIPFA